MTTRIYVVERREATGYVFAALVRATSQPQAVACVVNETFQAHAASADEVAAFIHHGGVRNAKHEPVQRDIEDADGA